MKPSLDQIEADIIHLAADTAKTQPPEDISAETMLRENLEFSSMDLIHLLASIDMHFHRKLKYDLLFMGTSQPGQDFSVREVAEFVYLNFDDQLTEPIAM